MTGVPQAFPPAERRDIDDEPWPIPSHHETPGPPPRRSITFGRPMVVMGALVVIAFVALTLFMCVPSLYGVSPG